MKKKRLINKQNGTPGEGQGGTGKKMRPYKKDGS